ncbi:MAG: cytochrome c-type biogenesis protein CcmH, partial [Terracidiphilus sp.]
MRSFQGAPERATAGAKALSSIAALAARLKSCPDTQQHPSEVHGNSIVGGLFFVRNISFAFWMKAAQALVLAVAVCFSVGATDAGARYNDLNHRLMCTCGCAEILGECNHVGCTSSTEELALLRAGLNAGKSDQEILDSFVAKYGAVVL